MGSIDKSACENLNQRIGASARALYPGNKSRVPHISLVFREMWDITALNRKHSANYRHLRSRPVVSHISRNTSEMWGTRDLLPIKWEYSAVLPGKLQTPKMTLMTQVDPMPEASLARGFRDVDTAAVGKLARCLTYMDALPAFQQYKNIMLEMMNPQRGSITADLGCGLGFDVRRLAALVGPEGRAIGVDASLALIESARSASDRLPTVEFIQADLQHLPFASGSLDSCKVDRTLQHVERPAAVLNEMFRSVCSGGAVVCAEPDWGTFAIDDGQHPIAREIAQVWREGFRNPRIGRELKDHLKEAGFVDLQVQEIVLSTPSFESSDTVFDITQSASQLARSTGNDEALTWLASLRDRQNRLCCSVTLLINFGKKP
jgi:ubiquinone/menaquinone biosynthesis C-methylase UbiE